MNLPKNEKRKVIPNVEPSIFIYGDSYVGKSTFADNLENCLIFNTDGNIDKLASPVITLKNEVETSGRIVKTKFAWEVFKDYVLELEKKDNEFEWITLDLVEDLRELCRVYMYDKLDIYHESDMGFGKAYDMVSTEFYSVIKRIKAAGYRLCLISKEAEGEVTLKTGGKYTTFRPNLPDKVSNTLAGLVGLTARAYVGEDNKRYLQLAKKDTVFGGGRFDFTTNNCELSMKALMAEINKCK